jgi:hypothetical protein
MSAHNSTHKAYVQYTHMYIQTQVRLWFYEWERGGMSAPGGFEAGLDGRHNSCRPLPTHYIALRNSLMRISELAASECDYVCGVCVFGL